MSDLSVELAAPGVVCPECFENRRDMSLGAGTLAVVVCYCRHSKTAAFWSPVSGWASRSPLSEEAFDAIVVESVNAATAQLTALRHVQTWALDRCTHAPGACVPLEEPHRDYSLWAHVETSGKPVSVADFSIALTRMGATIEQHAKGARCIGLRVLKLA